MLSLQISQNTPLSPQGEYAILAMWGLFGNVLPLTREKDYPNIRVHGVDPELSHFYGKPMSDVYDVHFVQVSPLLFAEHVVIGCRLNLCCCVLPVCVGVPVWC